MMSMHKSTVGKVGARDRLCYAHKLMLERECVKSLKHQQVKSPELFASGLSIRSQDSPYRAVSHDRTDIGFLGWGRDTYFRGRDRDAEFDSRAALFETLFTAFLTPLFTSFLAPLSPAFRLNTLSRTDGAAAHFIADALCMSSLRHCPSRDQRADTYEIIQ